MTFLKAYDFMSKNNKITNTLNKATLISALIFCIFLSGCCSQRPLNQAAWNNDIDQMKTLIDSGSPIDKKSAGQRGAACTETPLQSAVVQGNIEAVKILLENGADVNLSRYCHALTSGREIIIPGAPSGYYAFKGSALMLSSLIGNLHITKLLLDSGADVNQLTEKGLWQPSNLNEFDALSFSAELGHSEITKLLLKYGADPNRSINRALRRGRIDYVVTVMEENALEATFVELSSPNGSSVVSITGNAVEFAELAHIAADYYASSDEKKAILLYKQAIKFYPAAIKKIEWLHKRLVDNGTSPNSDYLRILGNNAVFSINSVKVPPGPLTILKTLNLRQTIKESEFFRPYSDGSIYYSYIKYEYEMDTDLIAHLLMKIKLSKRNLNLSKKISNCYESNKPNMALIDCVKSASKNNKL